ncbi:hypothetical protein [Chitinophaga pinensis]|uniref:Uncharacterized protein n=1 Tax=Chitinophaga pinensis TaxID=79329 RepID=A0A5C6LND9_9BACT|nr:hypothetical protein [Chitinophaga pinensis]TWV96896.1 hypothetical protein FEF09_22670 [Chitinophaga pinensis]
MARQNTFILSPVNSVITSAMSVTGNTSFAVRLKPSDKLRLPAGRPTLWHLQRQGRLIRHAFYPALDVRCDSSHINRLNKLLIQAAGDHTAVKGFRFNKTAGIDRFFSISPEIQGNDVLHIPAQHISQQHRFTALELKVIAVRIDFNSQQITGTDTVTIMIDSQEPFKGTDIPLYVVGEGTLLLTLQIRAIHDNGLSCNKQFLAADIIAVVPPSAPKRIRLLHIHSG